MKRSRAGDLSRLRRGAAIGALLLWLPAAVSAGEVPAFRAQTIDDRIEIGYGVAIGDVDGAGRADILLADKTQFVWYANPGWERHVLAEGLTTHDNVCIAARDVDGDGRVEVAVGAEWNPGDTVGSGAVFYLAPPEDRTERWTPISPYHMRYEATINDPETFTRPWTMSMIMYKHVGEDDRLQQFKCVEFVEELIYGHLRKNPLP